MALPTFFIIGAAKAGTTSLHMYLDQHPQIQMSATKEPHFFAGPENGIPYRPPRIARLVDYEELFDRSYPVRGEASPSYSNHPRRAGVPERIRALVPDARFVYLVRDPVARTVSHYHDAVAIGRERRSLRGALADLGDRSVPLLSHGMYASQLERYLRTFPQHRVMVVDHADLRDGRRALLREIFAFLGVEESFDCRGFDEVRHESAGRRVYPAAYRHLAERHLSPAARWLPSTLRGAMRAGLERRLFPTLEPAALEEDLRERLGELFGEEARRLRALTGQDFASWCV